MKTSILLALVGTSSHFASAAVHFTYAKQHKANVPSTHSKRRFINPNISYRDATYVVNVTVGTPGQAMTLELSTSSSDTWVMDARSSQCAYWDYEYSDEGDMYGTNKTLCIWGSFSPGNSSSCVLADTSSSDVEYNFTASYNDGSYAYGNYMYDVLTIEDKAIPNLTMGLVNETSTYALGRDTSMGLLGIGYNDSSSANLPDRLLSQGLINSTAYSIWVDDDAAASGSLLFGAIDTTKFIGNLTRLKSSYSYVDMMVQVVGINVTTSSGGPIAINVTSDEESSSGEVDGETGGDSFLFTAIFSPPDTMSTFPSDVASKIWEMAGAYYQEELEVALIGCSAASDTSTIFTMQLGGQGADGPIITAYMSDLVIPASEYNLSTEASYLPVLGNDVCLFGIQNSSAKGSSYSYSYPSGQYNLGSTMLRRTYSVLDLANSEVAVAPVVFGASTTSNIIPFESYGATVPSSTIICYYSDCYADGGNSDGTENEDGSSSGGLPGVLSVGALLGLCLGLGLGCLALGLIGFLVWSHRRKRSLATKENPSPSSAEESQPAPEMSTATGGHRSAPEIAQEASASSQGIDKGKGPEIAPSLPSRSVEEQPRASEAEPSGLHGPQS